MAAGDRVAVVTGANRGLGLEVCRQLARVGMKVVLTSRDARKGEAAAVALRAEDLSVDVQPLDVTDARAAQALAGYLDEAYGRLDVLVNNAGAVFDAAPGAGPEGADDAGAGEGGSVLTSDVGALARSLDVNALGALRCAQALAPLMLANRYGRIVNVSSGMGQLATMGSGWPGYRLSKTALNALTRILAEELRDGGVKVNAVCPGHLRTDLGGPHAPRSVEEGADTIVWLATLRDDGPTGGFFRDCKALAW
jgi:NAD(P)-dependent dehydrogenase (short-subunit alcohol dehydrogenase family)